MNQTDTHLARYEIPPKNANFDERIVVHSASLPWRNSDVNGVKIKVLEAVQCGEPRLTMLIQFEAGSFYDLRQHHGGEEFLVLAGSINDENGIYEAGCYVRNPAGTRHILTSAEGCTLFAKMGEFSEQDREQRQIETRTESLWLPGPVDDTSVLPLHMHDTRSVLLIRWDNHAKFKPNLNPQGEEVFVINGTLRDDEGGYTDHHWIRNPVPHWQSWEGNAETLIYYKNGHFPSLNNVVGR